MFVWFSSSFFGHNHQSLGVYS
jgi:hypothetical protein